MQRRAVRFDKLIHIVPSVFIQRLFGQVDKRLIAFRIRHLIVRQCSVFFRGDLDVCRSLQTLDGYRRREVGGEYV